MPPRKTARVAKKIRRQKLFVPPPGWSPSDGFTAQSVHTSKCDFCLHHVTDDNPVKQCVCGVNICWQCEQTRGGLHHRCTFPTESMSTTRPLAFASMLVDPSLRPEPRTLRNQAAGSPEFSTRQREGGPPIFRDFATAGATSPSRWQAGEFRVISDSTDSAWSTTAERYASLEPQDARFRGRNNASPTQAAYLGDSHPRQEFIDEQRAATENQNFTALETTNALDAGHSNYSLSTREHSFHDNIDPLLSREYSPRSGNSAPAEKQDSPHHHKSAPHPSPPNRAENTAAEEPMSERRRRRHRRPRPDVLIGEIAMEIAALPEASHVIGLYVVRFLGHLSDSRRSLASGESANNPVTEGVDGPIPELYAEVATHLLALVGPEFCAWEVANRLIESVDTIRACVDTTPPFRRRRIGHLDPTTIQRHLQMGGHRVWVEGVTGAYVGSSQAPGSNQNSVALPPSGEPEAFRIHRISPPDVGSYLSNNQNSAAVPPHGELEAFGEPDTSKDHKTSSPYVGSYPSKKQTLKRAAEDSLTNPVVSRKRRWSQ